MNGQTLLDRWIAWVRQYVALTEAQALVVVLWAMHTHYSERFHATGYLEIVAPTKRSGKTTLLEILGMLCRSAAPVATIRMLSVVKLIGAYDSQCTLLFDEAERLSSSRLGDERSLLATGYRQGQMHIVTAGQKFYRYPCYCPKAFALIGNLTDVLRDRGIPIELERQSPALSLTEHHETAIAEGALLVKDFREYMKEIERVPVIAPEWLREREREIWTPLVSMAHALGLHKATLDTLTGYSVDAGNLKQQPAKEYHSEHDERDADDRGAADRALADLRGVFKPGERAVFSAVAVDRMRGIHTAPWRTWKGAGLDEAKLAALLERFGVAPVQVRIPAGRKGTQRRGYTLADVNKPRV